MFWPHNFEDVFAAIYVISWSSLAAPSTIGTVEVVHMMIETLLENAMLSC